MSSVVESPFLLNRVIFFGRSLQEYGQMFDIAPDNWVGKKVLDVAAGPASFTAEARGLGIDAVACDPRYGDNRDQLYEQAREDMATGLERMIVQYTYNARKTPEEEMAYRRERVKAMKAFAEDYVEMDATDRYIEASLPRLPFGSKSFDLVLCAHLLFVYSDLDTGGCLETSPFDYEFHLRSILEMLRVSIGEVRIYPIAGVNQTEHPYLPRILRYLRGLNVETEIVPVVFKDIAGADRMLRIKLNAA